MSNTISPSNNFYSGTVPPYALTEFTHRARIYEIYNKESAKSRIWEKIWKVAAFVSIVALTALALISTIYCTLQSPYYLPLLITVILSAELPLAAMIYKYCKDKQAFHHDRVQFNDLLTKEHNKPNETLEQRLRNLTQGDSTFNKKLSTEERSTGSDAFALTLIETLWRISEQKREHSEELRKQLETCKQNDVLREKMNETQRKLEKLDPLKQQNTKDIEHIILPSSKDVELMGLRLTELETEALSRIQAAFHLATLTRPTEWVLPKLLTASWFKRSVAKGVEGNWNAIAVTKNGRVFTISEINQSSLVEIAKQLFIRDPADVAKEKAAFEEAPKTPESLQATA